MYTNLFNHFLALFAGALQEWMSVNPLFVAPEESVGFFNDDVTFSQGVEWYVLLPDSCLFIDDFNVAAVLAGFKDFLRKVGTSSTNLERNQKILCSLVFRRKSSV